MQTISSEPMRFRKNTFVNKIFAKILLIVHTTSVLTASSAVFLKTRRTDIISP